MSDYKLKLTYLNELAGNRVGTIDVAALTTGSKLKELLTAKENLYGKDFNVQVESAIIEPYQTLKDLGCTDSTVLRIISGFVAGTSC